MGMCIDEKEKWDKSLKEPSQWNTKSVIVLINQETYSVFFLLKVFIKKESSRLFLCPWRNHSRLTKSLWRLVLSLMHREMWFYFQSIRDCRKVNVKVVNKAKQTEGVYCFQKGPGSFLPTRKHYGILITTNSSLTILPTDENRLVKESRHI